MLTSAVVTGVEAIASQHVKKADDGKCQSHSSYAVALPVDSVFVFYLLCVFLGFSNGYWTLFITVAAESFGTNLRATVATTVPNFVRGAVIPITMLFLFLRDDIGVINSALVLALLTTVIALVSLWTLRETFHTDLNYNEKSADNS